jgi:hypothetical protein
MPDLTGTTLTDSARLRAWAVEVVATSGNSIVAVANKLVQFVLTGQATPATPATLSTTTNLS